MSSRLKFLSIIFIQIVWSFNCVAQTENGWFKRNWHNMNARFNGLYHAQELLNESVRNLKKQNEDDFTQVLSVFPFGEEEDAAAEKSNMDEIYKKVSKVIRKHPKSRWVDDAWFLIGKSYYFQYDAFSAIETFQHVVNQYPDGEKKYDAKLWIVMSYLQQEKYYDAEAIMALLNNEGNFPKRLQKDIAVISAEIYIRQQKYSQAIEQLEKAIPMIRVRDERSRYHFILGQLYLRTDQIPKSKENFIRTIKLNPVYDLAFQANLGLIQTISMSENQSLKTPRKHLKKMLRDDKNIDYFDQIYYQLAELEMQAGNKDLAIDYYKQSAAASSKNEDQKANAYLALATIHFEDRNYLVAQKYFDSTAMFVSEKRPDYENIKAKQLVLTELIENLVAVEKQDSLLTLAKMPREELDKLINQHIQDEKRAAEEKARQEEFDKMNQTNDPFNTPNKVANNPTPGGSWYFYNPSAVARGANDFKRKWGDRKLADNWRLASIDGQVQQTNSEETDGNEEEDPKPGDNLVYNPANDAKTQEILKGIEESKRKYYEEIPFSDEAKRSANAKIAKSLFNTGVIYEEDLKEYEKAKGYFLKLLERYPGNSQEAETYFHLHRIAGFQGHKAEQEKYSELLRTKHPKSPYNLAINNRDVLESMSTDKEVSKLYSNMYESYMAGQYDKALAIKTDADQKYAGNALQAKFDYLQTLIIGKTKGKEPYIEALQRLVDNYPGTAIANTASYTIELLRKKEQQVEPGETVPTSQYSFNPESPHFFIAVYDGSSASVVQSAFSDYNKEQHKLDNLKVNGYIIGSKNILAVQSFKNKDEAEKYYIEFIKKDEFYKEMGIQAYENFTISANNFRVLLGEKNTDAYAQFFFNNYIQ